MNKDGNVVSSKGGSVQCFASQKIYNNNLKQSKTILLKKKIGDIGITKYLPSFSKE
jgi:ribosomal protein L19